MSVPTLNVTKRDSFGKGPNRRLRDSGQCPAVMYMKGKEPVTISVSPKDVHTIIQGPLGRNTVMNVQIEGEAAPRLSFIREYQVHPVKRTFEHIDFWEITPDSFLTLTVPFAGEGRSEAERQGGKIRFTRDDLTVRCKPADIPSKITFDMTSLTAANHNITVSKVPVPSGVTPIYKHDFSLIQVTMPKVQAVAADTGKKGKDAKKGKK